MLFKIEFVYQKLASIKSMSWSNGPQMYSNLCLFLNIVFYNNKSNLSINVDRILSNSSCL